MLLIVEETIGYFNFKKKKWNLNFNEINFTRKVHLLIYCYDGPLICEFKPTPFKGLWLNTRT